MPVITKCMKLSRTKCRSTQNRHKLGFKQRQFAKNEKNDDDSDGIFIQTTLEKMAFF